MSMLYPLPLSRSPSCDGLHLLPPKHHKRLARHELAAHSQQDPSKGSHYWKQNSRKVYAISEDGFVEFQNGRRAKASRRDDGSLNLQPLTAKIDQLKQATESLQDITATINQLAELAKMTSAAAISDTCLHHVKDSFCCLICKGLMADPMYSTCCESLVGCQKCVEEWLLNADHCLKCRAEGYNSKVHPVKGLSAVLSCFKEMTKTE